MTTSKSAITRKLLPLKSKSDTIFPRAVLGTLLARSIHVLIVFVFRITTCRTLHNHSRTTVQCSFINRNTYFIKQMKPVSAIQKFYITGRISHSTTIIQTLKIHQIP